MPIEPVKKSGWDNRTFRLGSEMLIRIPSAEKYIPQVQKEQQWLPILASQLSLRIPNPIALGLPSDNYHWNWSIYNWIEGEILNIQNPIDSVQIAIELSDFIKQLHKIDSVGGPIAGDHNFYRGGSLRIYDTETKNYIIKLKDIVNSKDAIDVWEKALESKWQNKPVWVHGDLSADNVLVNHSKVIAVIDFGNMGVGDPPCDLVIAWNYFTTESRRIFRSKLKYDSATWARACGWALWKSLIMLSSYEDIKCTEAIFIRKVISDVIKEYELESGL